jgi:hypothetical protein
MGRAARLKKERKSKQTFGRTDGTDFDTIELKNPQRQNFGAFIQGNAELWRKEYLRLLTEDGYLVKDYRSWSMADERLSLVSNINKLNEVHLPVVRIAGRLAARKNRDTGMVEEGCGKGRELVICGAGPSLARMAEEYCTPERDVWGCNSAAIWLHEKGYHVTHGFSVDQTSEMLIEWQSAPDIEYIMASTVHVHLTEHLLSKGRKVRFFHNYVGLSGDPVTIDGETMGYEDWMYCVLYPSTIRTGSGLNSVNRAIDLALFCQYDKVYVLGMDCAIEMTAPPPNVPQGHPEYLKWLEQNTVMHANGDSSVHNGASSLTMFGEIDGIQFLTKPDMIVSAVWGVKTEQAHKERLRIVGSPLIDVLRTKDDTFLKRLPTLTNHHGEALFPEAA